MTYVLKSKEDNRVELVLMAGPRQIDKFMHLFDLFDKTKRVCSPTTFTFKMERDNPAEVIKNFILAAEKAEYQVVACFIVGESRGIYVDETCKVYSNGKEWGLMSDFLAQYGIEEAE